MRHTASNHRHRDHSQAQLVLETCHVLDLCLFRDLVHLELVLVKLLLWQELWSLLLPEAARHRRQLVPLV